MEHGNFQANKLESTLDNLSANILNNIPNNSRVSVDLGSVDDGVKAEDISNNDGIKYNNPVCVQKPKIQFMFETRFVSKIPFVIAAKNVCTATN